MAVIDPKDYGQISSGLVPRNLLQSAITGFGSHMKGGHDYPYLIAPASDPLKWDDVNDTPLLVGGEPVDPDYLPPYRNAPGLLDIHPNRMRQNMSATVQIGFEVITVQLADNPDFIQWRQITTDNWQSYWQIVSRRIPDNARIVEFAEDYDGSIPGYPDTGRPPYIDATGTYPPEAESLWEAVEDPRRHRWYRIKYLAFDENNDPVVGAISPPIPRGAESSTFVREVNYYKRNGVKGVDTLEDSVPPTPPTFVNNAPNNAPAGWSDTIPPLPVTNYLWVTRALVELSGNINTDVGWTVPAYVDEDFETARYSSTGVPNPDTIVGPTEDVATGTNEADLTAAGWVNYTEFNPDVHFYIATRTGSTGAWSNWFVERIRGEDGSKQLVSYKLLPVTSDYDDPTWKANNTPVGVDPSDQRWLESVQEETLFLINFRSLAELYPDGSFKRNWSSPRPFTSVDTYNDYISIHPDDTGIDPTKFLDDTIIKRFEGGVETHDPENLWLRSQLFKGQTDVIANDITKVITYQWYKIFNNGEFLTTPTDLGTVRDIIVNHADVTGRAIFQVTMTMADASGYTEIADAIADGSISANPVFIEEISIKDQVDGLDGRTVSASATQSRFLLNTTPDPDVLTPASVIIRAEVDNVQKSTLKWYYLNGADPINDTWVEITATTNIGTSVPKYTYKNANNDLVLTGGDVTTATDVFDLVSDDVYFKCESPASGNLSALEDWVMVSRVDQSILVDGESAFDVHLENPYHQVRVDEQGNYIAGELAQIQTNIEVRKGSTVQVHTAYTVTVIAVTGVLTDPADVLIGNDGGNKKIITIDESNANWDPNETSGSIELDVTLGAETKKVFIGLGTTLEPTGFTGLNIISDRGTFTFDYSAGGRDDIVLTAELTKQVAGSGNVPVAGYNYEWTVVAGRYKTFNAGQVITSATTNVLTVATNDLDGSAEYQCAAYLTKTGSAYDPPFYIDSVRINDVPDARTRILWNNNDQLDQPPLPLNEWSTYPDNTGGTDTWYKVTNAAATWYSLSVDGGITWSVPQRTSGLPGPPATDGTDGTNGVDGSKILRGAGAPSSGLGAIRDWYIDDNSPRNFYEKTAAAIWTQRGYLKGENGEDGSQILDGTLNPTGSTGNVGDWYTNTVTGDIFKKTGTSTWTFKYNNNGADGNDGITTGVQEIRSITLGGATDNGNENFFLGSSLEFTTMTGTHLISIGGSVRMYGGNFALYRIILYGSSDNSIYTQIESGSIAFDIASTSLQPGFFPFYWRFSNSRMFYKMAIQRISGSANTIVQCEFEGKIFN